MEAIQVALSKNCYFPENRGDGSNNGQLCRIGGFILGELPSLPYSIAEIEALRNEKIPIT
jgi:hypothetical protein